MTLEERIARAIDPEAWSRWDNQPSGDIKQGSARTNWTITAARRVIDGLHLDIISSRHSFDGLRHRYDLTGFIREDA
jgi:hypothetical protein